MEYEPSDPLVARTTPSTVTGMPAMGLLGPADSVRRPDVQNGFGTTATKFRPVASGGTVASWKAGPTLSAPLTLAVTRYVPGRVLQKLYSPRASESAFRPSLRVRTAPAIGSLAPAGVVTCP